MKLPEEIERYYNRGKEQGRLLAGIGPLEETRTRDILERFLPDGGVVLDVGGGTGPYAFWLAEKGYSVHLIDAVPLHIEQARTKADRLDKPSLAGMSVGDARQLTFADESIDAVLLLGPLYHLTDPQDRLTALREAYRVLKQGGVLIAAIIVRYASMMATIVEDRLDYEPFLEVVERDIRDGQHRDASGDVSFFTTAYFHEPEEVKEEIIAADFNWQATLAVEGPGWVAPNFPTVWEDEKKRAQLLRYASMVEAIPEMMGMSPHLISIGKKLIQ